MKTIVACLTVVLWGVGSISTTASAETNSPQSTPAQDATKIDNSIGVCHLVNSLGVASRDDPQSPVYGVNPLKAVRYYYSVVENTLLSYETNSRVILLQPPQHGTMEMGSTGGLYHPDLNYIGADHTTFMVEIANLKVKVVYHFKVIDGGAIGGTEGQDKENCPKGLAWKISTTNLNK